MLHINRRIKDIVGSTTLAITARAKELAAQGHDVVNFGAGEPDFDTPDFIKKAGIKAIESGFTKYTPSIGTQDLREAIVAKFQRDNGLVYKPNQIVVSCGAKHSLFNIIQVLVDAGDEVIFQSPYWVSYPEMVKAAGGKSVIIPTDASSKYKITPELLKKHITPKTKILIINSPSNPTGVMYHKEELAKIAEICVAHKIYVISDEIYEKLIYDTKEFTSIASLGKEIFDLTITVNGVSKAYAMTGWRIGYAAGAVEIMEYIKKYQDHSTSNPASISQVAAMEALKASQESIDQMCQIFKNRRDLMLQCLDRIPQLSYIRPEGAFYVFCDFSKVGDATVIAKKMLDEVKVAGIPGDGFGAPNYIRFSFATSDARIQEGISRVGKWIANQSSSLKDYRQMEKTPLLRELLLQSIQEKASDLHLTEKSPPIFRIDGRLVPVNSEPLTREVIQEMIFAVLSETQKNKFLQDKELDFSLALTGLDRFRVNVHMQRGSVEAAFRRISLFVPSMEDLHLPPVLTELARKQNGLVLITGPTGTGKTTTLASMINLINSERTCMIMCIEDPIEYIFTNKKSVVKQREVYRDTNSFAEALKRCLRQDPDVIVVGEMRDLETISTTLTAAETGHLVLATLHTPDAPQTIERIIDVFPPYQQQQVRLQLSSVLQGVVSQKLAPRASGVGRIMVPEIMIATAGVRNMIRERAVEQLRTAIQTGGQYGMRTFDKSLKELYEKEVIDYQTAMNMATDVNELKSLIGRNNIK